MDEPLRQESKANSPEEPQVSAEKSYPESVLDKPRGTDEIKIKKKKSWFSRLKITSSKSKSLKSKDQKDQPGLRNLKNQGSKHKNDRKGKKEMVKDVNLIIASNADTEKDDRTVQNLKIPLAPVTGKQDEHLTKKAQETNKKNVDEKNPRPKVLQLNEWSTLEDYKTEQEEK